jgi:hypothetical protein
MQGPPDCQAQVTDGQPFSQAGEADGHERAGLQDLQDFF